MTHDQLRGLFITWFVDTNGRDPRMLKGCNDYLMWEAWQVAYRIGRSEGS